MPSKTTLRHAASLALAAGVTGGMFIAEPAEAGEFRVASCQADQLNYSTVAFGDFANRGMKVRRACNPEGLGIRGLVTSNVIRRTPLAKGSRAMVAITAPPGTKFTTFRWAGSARRVDCRYSLQLFADAPGARTIPIKNVRANQSCPPETGAERAAYRSRTFNVNGSTRIVQQVTCVGGRGRDTCSAGGSNFIRTYQAEVGIVDTAGPTLGIASDTALAQGQWVRGSQALGYAAEDNVGVRSAQAVVVGRIGGSHQRDCQMASPDGSYAQGVPCPNGAGRIDVDTKLFPNGTQSLTVQAQDTAGNSGSSAPVIARIDNEAPARVDIAVEGSDRWRATNQFAIRWTNPAEADRAPIVAASYKLCPAAGGDCTTGVREGADISSMDLQVPGPGAWTVTIWRRDAAGNESADAASTPVNLRFDPEAPKLAFDQLDPNDPTLIGVTVTDAISGLGSGGIEMARQGSDTWQALETQQHGGRLVTRLDDAGLPAGPYMLRARATDQAGNEASTDRRADGQPMVVALPLRMATTLRAGVSARQIVKQTVGRGHRKRVARRRPEVLQSSARRRYGQKVTLAGQLTNPGGQGLAGADIQIAIRDDGEQEQTVATVRTGASGRFEYRASARSSHSLLFRYAGSSQTLPSDDQVRIVVPAQTSFRVSRSMVLNGQAVTFSGRVKTLPVPATGKLVEVQTLLSGGWQTFRTTRTGSTGRWKLPYRFKRTRGVQRFKFRVRLPVEAGFPFADGGSRTLQVRVRGQ